MEMHGAEQSQYLGLLQPDDWKCCCGGSQGRAEVSLVQKARKQNATHAQPQVQLA